MERVRTAGPMTVFFTTMITCLSLVWATPVSAQSPDRNASQFRQIITSQIEAFRRDDAVVAYSHAAPSIKGIFGTPTTFIEMVRRDYGVVYRPRDYGFGPVTGPPWAPVQQVNIIGPNGVAWIALYSMQRQADGSWRISGVSLVKQPGKNA